MPVNGGWAGTNFLALHRDHIVQLYKEERDLVESVTRYALDALRYEHALLFFATRDHCHMFRAKLAEHGVRIDKAVAKGQVAFIAIEDIMTDFMRGAEPDDVVFERLVNAILDHAERDERFHHVHVFGEIVNVLWRDGNKTGTLLVEELWNRLRLKRPFTLYCGFQVNETPTELLHGPMRDVLHTHTSLLNSIPDVHDPIAPRGILVELADLTRPDAHDVRNPVPLLGGPRPR